MLPSVELRVMRGRAAIRTRLPGRGEGGGRQAAERRSLPTGCAEQAAGPAVGRAERLLQSSNTGTFLRANPGAYSSVGSIFLKDPEHLVPKQ